MELLWQEFPIMDFSVPTPEQLELLPGLVGELIGSLELGRNIALHCYGGIGRAGTLAGILLGQLGMTGEEAIKHVRLHRRGAIETQEQEALVRAWGHEPKLLG